VGALVADAKVLIYDSSTWKLTRNTSSDAVKKSVKFGAGKGD